MILNFLFKKTYIGAPENRCPGSNFTPHSKSLLSKKSYLTANHSKSTIATTSANAAIVK